MNKVVSIGVIILSLIPAILNFLLSKFGVLKLKADDPTNYVLFGLFVMLFVGVSAFLLFRGRFSNVDPLMYVLSWFACSALIGLGLAVELDGLQPWGPANLSRSAKEMFPFIDNSTVTMGLYWNGTVMYILAIAIIVLYIRRDSHREVGLYWAAGLLNGALVVWPTVFTASGKSKMAHSGLLVTKSLVHISLAVVILARFLHKRPVQARSFLKFDPLWKRPVDLFFFVYFLLALDVALLRGLAVNGGNVPFMKTYLKTYEPYLTDPSGFPKTQALTFEYMYAIYYLFALYGLLCPGQHWMADFSLVHAGASAQAQFVYMSGALHWHTGKDFRAPLAGQAGIVFWTVNGLLFLVPHLFALWCQRDAEKFGRTYTTDLATPVQTYVVSSSRKSVRSKRD